MMKHLLNYVILSILALTPMQLLWANGMEEVSIQKKEMSLVEAIGLISRDYNVYFTFDHELVKDITVEYETREDLTVEEAISGVLSGTDLKFKLYDKRFVILYQNDVKGLESLQEMIKHFQHIIADGPEKKAARRYFKPVNAIPLRDAWVPTVRKLENLAINVSGTITDQEGEPLIGVNVQVKGTNKGTATDFAGKYELNDVNENAILVFSYIGYQTQEIPVDNRSTVDITMLRDAQLLDEVVVVGYGTQKKSDLTGAISSIGSKEINQAEPVSILDAIQGKVPGVMITNTSGIPGASSRVSIRGTSSLYSGTTPLFVIDGIPFNMNSSEIASGNTGNAEFDPLSFINPSDIESIEVLKDASSAAIYGASAANGVILITTKSGNLDGIKLNLNSNIRISTIDKKIEVLNQDEFIEYNRLRGPDSRLFYETVEVDGIPKKVPRDPYNLKYHNWQDEVLQNGFAFENELSIYGSLPDGSNIGASIGYYDEKPIVLNNSYNKYSYRIKYDKKFTVLSQRELKFGLNIIGGYSQIKGVNQTEGGVNNGGLIYNLTLANPVELYIPEVDDIYGKYISPIAMINKSKKEILYLRNNISTFIEYNIFNNLKIRTTIGGSLSNSKSNEFYGKDTPWGAIDDGKGSVSQRKSLNFFNTNQLSYSKKFDKSIFTVLGAFEIRKYDFESFGLDIGDFGVETNGVNDISKGSLVLDYNTRKDFKHTISYFGRLNYKILSKYIFAINFRSDGSNRFGSNSRYGYFPAGSFGWVLSEEPFVKDLISDIDLFKLRISYGKSGNDQIPSFRYLALLDDVRYNGELGFSPISISNSTLSWESTTELNFGIDLTLLNKRVIFNFDYYRKKTSDMLYPVLIPAQSGFEEQWQNRGKVKNIGFETLLKINIIQNRKLNWITNFNFSSNVNTVESLGDVEFLPVSARGIDVGRVIQGQPLGLFYGYSFSGVYQIDDFNWQNNNDPNINYSDRKYTIKDKVPRFLGISVEPGSLKFEDINDDGIVDEDDRSIIGQSSPKFIGGLQNNILIKNISINFLFDFSYGNEVYYDGKRWLYGNSFSNSLRNISSYFWDNKWSPDNPTDKLGNYSVNTDNATSLVPSSFYVEDASWFRLKNISIGYSINNDKINSSGINSIRLYFKANNLFTWTKYSGFSPEVNSGSNLLPGIERFSYPRTRSFIFGININI